MTTPSIDFHWYNDDKTALVMNINQYEATWNLFDRMALEGLEMAKSVPHELIFILNPNDIPMPKVGAPIPHFRQVLSRRPANVPMFIAVLGKLGFFEKGISDILANVSFRGRIKLVNTLEEAYALIPKLTDVATESQ